MIQTLKILGWHPPRANEFTWKHWRVVSAKKKKAAKVVADWAAVHKLVPATGRRRLDVTIVLAKGQRAPDSDAFDKALRDALVHAGLLMDDNRIGLEATPVVFKRSGTEAKWTEITLTDVEPAPPIEVLDKGPKRTRRKAVKP